jgi:hypothetical protein
VKIKTEPGLSIEKEDMAGLIKTTKYDFEHDLKDFDVTQTRVCLPSFTVEGNTMCVFLQLCEGETKYDTSLCSADGEGSVLFPGVIHYQFEYLILLAHF